MTAGAPRRCLLAAVTLLAVGSAATPAAAAGGSVDVLSRTLVGEQTRLVVAAPPLAGPREPDPDFVLEQAGVSTSVTAAPLPAGELAVAVVLASSDRTGPEAFRQGQVAAFEVLRGLPAAARSAVVSTASPVPLSALSTDRTGASEALRDARAGGGDTDDAVQRAAALLPAGGHVVLVSDGSAGPGTGPTAATSGRLQADGLVLHELRSGAGAAPGAGAGTDPAVAAPLLRQVDEVLLSLAHRYQVQAVLDPYAPATLTVVREDTREQVLVAPTRSLGEEFGGLYAQASGPSAPQLAGYGLAGLLALAGLVLVLRRPSRARTRTSPALGAPVDVRVPVGAQGRS